MLRLTGALYASDAGGLALDARRHAEAARALGHRLVLDLTDVTLLSGAAAAALSAAAHDAWGEGEVKGEPAVAAVADARIRAVLTRALPPSVRVHATIGEALASPGEGPSATAGATRTAEADGALRDEVLGLRAKARSHGLIDFAQGIVLARYRLARPTAALELLKHVSQERNVPLRALASAVVAAPPPPRASGSWFPGRRRTPPPEPAFLRAHDAAPGGRARALQAAVDEAVAHARSDAGALHLADPAQGGALVLEAHRGLGAAYRDAYAHITVGRAARGTAVARAQATGLQVAGTETVPGFAGRLADDGRLGAGPHAVHAVPLVLTGGRCTGTLSVQHARADAGLAPQREAALRSLASDVAAWHSWYQRTVLLDALELLHARAAEYRA